MRIAEMAIQQPNKAATKESTVQLDVHNVHVFTHSVLTAPTIQAITTRKADSVLRALALVYRVLDAHSKEVIVHARTIMVAITIAVAITVVRSNRVAIVLVTTITMVKKVVISHAKLDTTTAVDTTIVHNREVIAPVIIMRRVVISHKPIVHATTLMLV